MSIKESTLVSVAPYERVMLSLRRNRLTSQWLLEQLSTRGVAVDKTELSRILSGTRNGKKAAEVITESLLVIAKYEKCFTDGDRS